MCIRDSLCRYGKKSGRNKMDLFKAIHYIVLLLDSENKSNEKPDMGIDVDAFNGS